MGIRNAVSADMIVGPRGIGPKGRGLNVYQLTELIGVDAQAQDGSRHRVTYEQPIFYLTIDERVHIVKQCAPVQGIVSSRMARIAGLDWKVVSDAKNEDKQAQFLKYIHGIYEDWRGVDSIHARILLGILHKKMRETLFDLLPDASNFDRALLRWSRMIKHQGESRAGEIEDWLSNPNPEDDFEELTKKLVFDMMVHGSMSVYKKSHDDVFDAFYALPGGSVIPVKRPVIDGLAAYVQIVDGFDPLIYYGNELYYSEYMPTTYQAYGMVPLESLVNKVAEYLLFDQLAAQRSDQTKPPEKLVVLGDNMPFGALNAQFSMALPLNEAEQKRVEQIINEERKDAVRVLSGVGQPVVVDVSRADTFQAQSERQRQLKEDIALVFNATNLEVNLTGSESVSGRATSETQERIDKSKGVGPLVKILNNFYNDKYAGIIPQRFGGGYTFEYDVEIDERAEIEKLQKKAATGTWTINELRIEDGRDPIDQMEADLLSRTDLVQHPDEMAQLGLEFGNTP